MFPYMRSRLGNKVFGAPKTLPRRSWDAPGTLQGPFKTPQDAYWIRFGGELGGYWVHLGPQDGQPRPHCMRQVRVIVDCLCCVLENNSFRYIFYNVGKQNVVTGRPVLKSRGACAKMLSPSGNGEKWVRTALA